MREGRGDEEERGRRGEGEERGGNQEMWTGYKREVGWMGKVKRGDWGRGKRSMEKVERADWGRGERCKRRGGGDVKGRVGGTEGRLEQRNGAGLVDGKGAWVDEGGGGWSSDRPETRARGRGNWSSLVHT